MRGRSYMLSLAAPMAMMALTSAGPVVVQVGDVPPPVPLRRKMARQDGWPLTEADNVRLREAAERRFKKAQRQAKGFR